MQGFGMLKVREVKTKTPRDRVPVSAEIERAIRQRIIEGVYRPHAYLPSERQLARDFATSRVTVSSALGALERDGLVSRSPGRGTRILPITDRLTQSGIGIIHGELPSMEDFARQDSLKTLQGVRDTLEGLGYSYKLMSVPASQELSIDEFLARFGAMIFIEVGPAMNSQLAELEQRKIPVVVAKLEADLDVCATLVDHQEPMRQAVHTFVKLGHRRIAFVGREATYGIHGKARAGYITGLRETGLSIDESLMAVCEKTDALSGYFAARALLQSAQPPSAIVAARDSIAEGVCRAIEEAGLVVGHHVSVIGFDDTTWPEGREFLTTFREPCHEMGAAAAEMLVQRIVNGWIPPEKRQFEVSFMLRRTAGPYISPRQSIPVAAKAAGPELQP